MRARGFTLVELLVAVAVSLIVVFAAVSLMLGTQRLFRAGDEDRAIQETARVALDELGRNLAGAGYGLEPTFVFDFGQAATVMDRVPVGTQVRFGGYACKDNPVACRDRIDAPDEVVFYARDPLFGKDLTGPIGVNAITLAGPIKPGTLGPGQILQLMCYGGSGQWLWAYVTIATVDATNPAAVSVTLATNSGGLPNDFPYQNDLVNGQPCFGSGARRAYKIDRYRYFVRAIDDAGNVKDTPPWQTPSARPYLLLDQGLLDANGQPIVSVVAPDVEDLQVAYVYPVPNGTAAVVGATSGTQITATAAGIDLAPDVGCGAPPCIPAFSTPTIDPIRTTHHPANLRAVRVAITVRSSRSDPKVFEAQVPEALNRPAVAGEAGYRRLVFESTTYVHNMENRLPVFPTYDPTYTASCAGTAGNCGGG